MAGFGCIFKNKAGDTDHQATGVELNIASPLVAEALALDGLSSQLTHGTTPKSVSTQIVKRS
ncbi:unnamed protein product [Brassica rapa]|uniref:Uncharacterized protein n=1 Tax=Brassica campestris TaxID=3711 RepID=A0A3P6A688_BRACM|nr:unnamed protein product [Brassica rapa]VDC83034.1 unnamed protein product [Brassica rapa]